MNKIDNKQGICKITMFPIAYTKCAIGQDWFKNELEIVFKPNGSYPDYIEVNDYIMREVDGRELNIEDVVEKIFWFVQTNYRPLSLHVTDNIKGCKTHFDVKVEKHN